ncbi:MAG: hypothetical protein R3F13_21205 [Prosthecobacter sp.]
MQTPPPLPVTETAWSHDEVAAYLNQPLLDNNRPVAGTEGMNLQQIEDDVLRGGRFRVLKWNFSVIIMSFQRSAGLRYIRSTEGPGLYAWPWTLLSLVVGWWGIPWGIIYTISTLYTNCMGGTDVTADLLASVLGQERSASIMQKAVRPEPDVWLWLLRIFVLAIPVSIYMAIAGIGASPR